MNEKRCYFAALNSGSGFVSYFDENFRAPRAERCYILKGGPGTGKSRLLAETARAAEAEGGTVEYYYCSSDPASLDGIFAVLPGGGSFSVIDGTAPHTADTRCPGVSDSFVDLGAFWNEDRLWEARATVGRLAEGKRAAHARANLCLSSAGALTRAADALTEECLDRAALSRTAAELAGELGAVQGAARSACLRSPLAAYGMQGLAAFDTFSSQADRTVRVGDVQGLGLGVRFITVLSGLLGACRVSPDPLCPEKTAALLVPTADGTVAVSAGEEGGGPDLSACFSETAYRRVREELSALRRMAARSLTAASGALAAAARCHFALEHIYSGAMDFDAKEKFTAGFCASVLARGLRKR